MGKKRIKVGKNLRSFLRQENAYNNFLRNCRRQWDKPITIEGIAHAFTWRETPQGHKYWNDLEIKYNPTGYYNF